MPMHLQQQWHDRPVTMPMHTHALTAAVAQQACDHAYAH